MHLNFQCPVNAEWQVYMYLEDNYHEIDKEL